MTTEKELVKVLAGQIRRHREQLGQTIEELAHEVGMHADYLGHLERGDKVPSFSLLIKLAVALGIHPLDLFRVRHEPLSPDQRLQALVRGFSPEQKQDLFSVISSLRKKTGKVKALRALLDS